MNIDELLNMMEEMLEEATGLPFAGGKRVVDADRMQDIIDEVRLNLPTEVRQAKAIVKKAEDRARVLVSEQEVVKAAQQRAAEIVSSAQTQARTMRTTVTDYCENMLRTTEEQLARSAAEVKTVRANLRQSAKNG